MKALQKILLFLIVIGAFVIALNIHIFKRQNFIHMCRNREVTQFSFREGIYAFVAGARDDGSWLIVNDDYRNEASDTVIESLKSVACHMPYVEKFEFEAPPTQEELTVYGLAGSTEHLTVATAKTEFVYYIGRLAPSGTEHYLGVSTQPKIVYTVNNHFSDNLVPSFVDVMKRRLLSGITQYERLDLEISGKKLSLKKSGKAWHEENGRVTDQKAGEILELLQAFSYSNFVGPEQIRDPGLYGLDYPDVRLTLHDDNKQTVAHTLSWLNEKYYLSLVISGKTYVMILKPKQPKMLFDILHQWLAESSGSF